MSSANINASPSAASASPAPQPGLGKTYTPAASEPSVRARWETSSAFRADPARVLSGNAKPYCILIPPPNVTGALHLGHALNNTLQDILTRSRRMMRDAHGSPAFETLWMPGTDHAGIATQAVVEKRLLKEQGKRRKDFTREQFVALVQKWKDEYEARITEQLKAMGCSCDFSRQRFTMDEICARAVREAFFILFRDGLIYRGKRLVNWDPALQTAVADDECYEEEVDAAFYYLRYPLVRLGTPTLRVGPDSIGSQSHAERGATPVFWSDLAKLNYPTAADHPPHQQAWVTVATTRPETYLGDTAVAISQHDPRAPMLRGMSVQLPLVNRIIPIVEDTSGYVVLPKQYARTEEEAADPKAQFATGFLKVTPAHDNNDYQLGELYKSQIATNSAGQVLINILSPDGKLSDQHGWQDTGDAKRFVGMQVMQTHDAISTPSEARKAVVDALKQHKTSSDGQPILESIRKYTQTLKFSDRSKAVIEPYLSDQWFMRVTDDRLAGSANRALVADQQSPASRSPERKPGDQGHTTHQSPTDHQLRFHPARYAKTYEQWHDNIRDWCISRQLWWGHRIPVWTKNFESLREFNGSPGSNQDSFSDTLCSLDVNSQFLSYTLSSPDHPGVDLRGIANNAMVVKSRNPRVTVHVCVHESGTLNTRFGAMNLEHWLEAHGFQRDPDVLDTWFSSALWPLSTLGWPDPAQSPHTNNLLQAFNPTSVLSTAREIITLWVSRMVMMNRYLLGTPTLGTPTLRVGSDSTGSPSHAERGATHSPGPVPFHNVFIHAVVQDGDGKRMSKSAGNGVDPLDIIDSHGADAMRFTLCQMTTSTQDVRMPVRILCPHCKNVFAAEPKLALTQHEKGIIDQKCPKCAKPMCTSFGVNNNFIQPTDDKPEAANTSEKFDLGRNLCNKLWNASRFTLSIFERIQAAGAPAAASSASSGTLIDRWMLSRLASATRDCSRALENFEFSDYAETIYKLLWWDFCDWYLEAIKPTVDKSPEQQAVLAHALETILRLLHPIAPFITESIYEHVRQLRTSPIPGVTLAPPLKDNLLCTAGWPQLSESFIDPAAEAQFEELRELINQIRNVRSEHQVLPKRKITLHAPQAIISKLAASPGLVETLANLDKIEPLASGGAGVPPASVPFRALGLELALSNLADAKTGVDAAAEIDRLKKQLETLTKSETALAGRLNNPGYVDKAPAKLVEESKAQLAKIRAELEATAARIKDLGGS